MKPPGFSRSRNYPVLMHLYAGPGSQLVLQSYSAQHNVFSMYMAAKGFIVVTADGRGTGGRSAKFMQQIYLEAGVMETADQLEVLKQLRDKGYVDSENVAIWGWVCVYEFYIIFNAKINTELWRIHGIELCSGCSKEK